MIDDNYRPTPHFLAFVDALGFSKEIKGAATERANKYFQVIAATTAAWAQRGRKQDLKIRAIGDSLIIGVEDNQPGTSTTCELERRRSIPRKLYDLCFAVGELQATLAMHDIWTRGAITYDQVEFNDKRIVGPAFHNALKLEEQVAKYPRVILDGKIIDACGLSTAGELVATVNAVDENKPLLYDFWLDFNLRSSLIHDVPTFVDFIRIPPPGFSESELLKQLVPSLARHLRENVEHFAKYKWLAEYIKISILRSGYQPGPFQDCDLQLKLLDQC
jgi:hypothetical protein